MDFENGLLHQAEKLTIRNFLPEIGKDQLQETIIDGLIKEPRTISSMFFYDEKGSEIYEEITKLPEYYPPRVEMALIIEAGEYLKNRLDYHDIIELGSGDCSKISTFLDQLTDEGLSTIRYVPVDFSQSAIVKSAGILLERYQGISVFGIVGDFLCHLETIPNGNKRLFICFGSTIGNLEPYEAQQFLKDIRYAMQPGDRMLLGVDLIKDKEVLEKAYNDSQGITAEFNRNIINVVNELLETDMEPDDFDHVAFFNEQKSRIEMHLRPRSEQVIQIPGYGSIKIAKGELIHTESSYKFTNDAIKRMVKDAGLKIENVFSDDNEWFSLVLMRKL